MFICVLLICVILYRFNASFFWHIMATFHDDLELTHYTSFNFIPFLAAYFAA